MYSEQICHVLYIKHQRASTVFLVITQNYYNSGQDISQIFYALNVNKLCKKMEKNDITLTVIKQGFCAYSGVKFALYTKKVKTTITHNCLFIQENH